MNDVELVMHAQGGDAAALAEVVTRHGGYVVGAALRMGFYMPEGDRDDLCQEALVGLLKAVRTYRPSFGREFRPFAVFCVRRWLIWVCTIKPRNAGRHLLTEAARVGIDPDGEFLPLVELAEDPRADIPALAEDRETLRRVRKCLPRMTDLEARSILGVALGLSYSEIDNPDRVDNAVQRARKKLLAEAA